MLRDIPQDGPLARAFTVIEFVAAQARSVSIAEVAEGTGLPLPTAHRLVGSLEEHGLLCRAVGSKRVEIGRRMFDLSVRALGASFHNAERQAVLRDLAHRLGEQCEIGIVRDDQVVYVDSARPQGVGGLQFDPGIQAPLHCSSTGKLFLSRKSVRPRERLVRALSLKAYTDQTLVDPDQLLADLARTRKRGWAASNQEFLRGVVGCAVPVFADDGAFVAALGVSAPVARVTPAELEGFIPHLKQAALRLQSSLSTSETDPAPGSTA